MLRGTDVTKGFEEKVGWISATFQPDAPVHPKLPACPFSLRPLSPARWPLPTGSGNKSPGRLVAGRQHRHPLATDYRHSNMMRRVTSASLLLAAGGALFSTPCPWNPSPVLQPPLQLIPGRAEKTGRRFCLWIVLIVCFYPRSDDARCARGCMSGWWIRGCTVWTSL